MLKKVLIILGIFIGSLNADLIPEGRHVNYISTYITNINQYPEYDFLGCVSFSIMLGSSGEGCYKLSNNQQIDVAHKTNLFQLVAVKKEILKSFGDINATNYNEMLDSDNESSSKIVQIINTKGFPNIISKLGEIAIEDKYTVSAEKHYFEIDKIEDSNITLKLKKRVVTFNDGREDATIEY